jgi:AcrR family transcriptional regulator
MSDHSIPKEEPVPAAHDPIREQLIEARRNQILDAAAHVFAEKGFHRATTKEIAAQAGISEGTIYNYFANKPDLLVGIMTRLADVKELPEALASSLQSDMREFFIAMCRDRLRRIKHNHAMIQAVLPEIFNNPELREQFYQQFVQPTALMLEQFLQARIDLGHVRPLNATLAVRTVQSMFVGLLILRIMGDAYTLSNWDELPEMVAGLLFDGLNPRGEPGP